MKQFLKILLMVIMLSILTACADNQESNQNNTEMPSVSHTENENLEDNSQFTEYGDDIVDSTEDINIGETYWISGSTVNFRKTPSTNGEVLGQLAKGTEIIKIDEDGDWLYISYGETKGYIHRDYVMYV